MDVVAMTKIPLISTKSFFTPENILHLLQTVHTLLLDDLQCKTWVPHDGIRMENNLCCAISFLHENSSWSVKSTHFLSSSDSQVIMITLVIMLYGKLGEL